MANTFYTSRAPSFRRNLAPAVFDATCPNWVAFARVDAAIAAWLVAKRDGFEFAASVSAAVCRFGGMTPGQRAAVEKMVARDAAPRVAPVTAPVDASKIVAAFNAARAAGLRRIKLAIGGLVFKAAPITGMNPGAIYVTTTERQARDFRTGEMKDAYLGKISDLTFTASRDVVPAEVLAILNVAQDPANAARTSGLSTGICSCCSRTLTDPVSVSRGIGPICEQRFGWTR